MKHISGLSSNCRSYIGKTLEATLQTGWGWQRKNYEECISLSKESYIDSVIQIIPNDFFTCVTETRGFTGNVVRADGELRGKKIVAFTMSDGDDYNFEGNICEAWRFYFGDGVLSLDQDRPILNGADVIMGYGFVKKSQE